MTLAGKPLRDRGKPVELAYGQSLLAVLRTAYSGCSSRSSSKAVLWLKRTRPPGARIPWREPCKPDPPAPYVQAQPGADRRAARSVRPRTSFCYVKGLEIITLPTFCPS